MADSISNGSGLELQRMDGGLPEDLDYDLEYLVRNRGNNILIQRKPLNEATFEKGIQPIKSSVKDTWYKSFIPPEPVRSSLLPPLSGKEWFNFLLTRLPILSWIWSYQLSFILDDVLSGFTVAIMHIPQGLAYGLLAGLPAVYGLYGSFMPVIVYCFLGTSKHISVGTFAVVSLMVSNAISGVLENDERFLPCANLSVEEYSSYNVSELDITCETLVVNIAVTVAFASGLVMFIMGVFQLGFVTIFLSESLISGYTTGAAIHVFTSQLKHIFGLDLKRQTGLFVIPKTWIEAITKIFHWPIEFNLAATIISLVTIVALIIFRIVDRRWLRKLDVPCPKYDKGNKKWMKKKIRWPMPLPSQLIVVIIATIVSYAASLNDRFNVNIIENIPLGLPPFTPPSSSYFFLVLKDGFVIGIVTFSIAVSLAQVFAREFKYNISPNQEFIAYGSMNMVGSFFGSINSAGSLSRSTVQAVSGGKTQMVGFVSSAIILFVLIVLGQLFEPLPNAVLASIIWVALYGMFSQVKDVWRYFKLSVPDMFIWLVVFVATVLLGVDLGLAMGVGFSLTVVVLQVVLPKSSVLGRVQETELYRNIENFENVQRIPGIVVYRFQAPICFINVKVFLSRLDIVCGVDRSVKASSGSKPGCIQALYYKLTGKKFVAHSRSPSFDVVSTLSAPPPSNDGIRRSRSFQKALKQDLLDIIVTKKPQPGSVHTLILDCAPISFMDAMGVKLLQQLVLDFDHMGIQVLFAAMTKHNRDKLERVGFFEKCGKEWLFPSIQDAINHAQQGAKLRPGDKEEELMTSFKEEGSEDTTDNDGTTLTTNSSARNVEQHSSANNVNSTVVVVTMDIPDRELEQIVVDEEESENL